MSTGGADLEAVGITDDMLRVYEAMWLRPPITVDELEESLPGTDPGRVRARIVDLVRLKLVTSPVGDSSRFVAVSPGVGLSAVVLAARAGVADTSRRLAGLAARTITSATDPDTAGSMTVVTTRELARVHNEGIDAAVSEVRGVDAPPYLGDPNVGNQAELRQLRRGLTFRILYNRGSLDLPARLPDLEQSLRLGEQARVGDLPIKLTLYDDTHALLITILDGAAHHGLVVRNRAVLTALSALFERHWADAEPVTLGWQEPGLPPRPVGVERRVLGLLAAGATDLEIAAQVGLSERTVRRYVAGLTETLGARTRFQAGYRALQLGWLVPDIFEEDA